MHSCSWVPCNSLPPVQFCCFAAIEILIKGLFNVNMSVVDLEWLIFLRLFSTADLEGGQLATPKLQAQDTCPNGWALNPYGLIGQSRCHLKILTCDWSSLKAEEGCSLVWTGAGSMSRNDRLIWIFPVQNKHVSTLYDIAYASLYIKNYISFLGP